MDTEIEIIDSNSQTSYLTLGVSIVSSLAAGFVIGYILGKKSASIEIQTQEFIREYDPKEFVREYDPSQLSLFDINEESSEIEETIPNIEYISEVQEVEEVEEAVEEEAPIRVIRSGESSWDYETEVAGRTSTQPYIIHQDEFINAEMELHQETVTYYVADDILADSNDTPIYNYAAMLGELKFGHGSNDENIVYIRNEKFNMEWEVLRHEGSFAYEVLGQQLDVDDEPHAIQKFRHE